MCHRVGPGLDPVGAFGVFQAHNCGSRVTWCFAGAAVVPPVRVRVVSNWTGWPHWVHLVFFWHEAWLSVGPVGPVLCARCFECDSV